MNTPTFLPRDHRLAAPAVLATAALLLAGCSAGSTAADPAPTSQSPAAHIHAIAVGPASSEVLLATHDGLYDASKKQPVKISDTIDLMGFTATADPAVFYASGHPGAGSALPDPVGLIKSEDSGKTWNPVSRQGQSDFHALTSTKSGLVAFDGTLQTSADGVNWTPSPSSFAPAALAGSPASTVVLATTEQGLQRSTDGGKTWQPNPGAPIMQYAAFATAKDKATTEAVGVAPDGTVYASADAGLSWVQTGQISGQVQAVTAVEGETGKPRIWAATSTGVQVSKDGGMTFSPADSS
ncbi:F510_1955 family glycosylhydrolase [Paenarthrobacter sp. PH39-S1]|uniref:F510_1955 family glycosylhydrolase n=1 Tax=Paenarthrobacter sp. PH39-S1 TaxID=3046204 RepID=UPI0024BB5BF0|nr:exo-alpha-sialidase [Paenarthrobacter sp. PH39-S1]MDJ0354562.1 exo-alpha-sialidase [Paenarthrobacter sp. PH39-S1]